MPWGLQRLTFVWGLIEWKGLTFSMCRRWKKGRWWKGGIWQGAEEGLGHLAGDEQEPWLLQGESRGCSGTSSAPYSEWGVSANHPSASLHQALCRAGWELSTGTIFFHKKSMLTKHPTGNCMFSLKREQCAVSKVTGIPLKQSAGDSWHWLGVWCN